MQFTQVSRENFRDMIRWKNTSGEVIPAFGVVQIGQWNDTNQAYDGTKPDDTGTFWVANGPVDIPVDAYGTSEPWIRKQIAITNGISSSPVGKRVGPVDGQWYMSQDGMNQEFLVMSPIEETRASVIWKGGGGGGGGEIIFFTIDTVDCDGNGNWLVTVTHYSGGCADPPGADPYTGQVTVVPSGCGSMYTTEELEASGKGAAAYVYPTDDCSEGQWRELPGTCATSGCA